MKATWFENKELITLYTDPAYFGADVPDSYAKRPSKPVPVDSLFGYEPESKMDDIHHKNSMLKMALKMKTGTWGGKPIIVRKDPKGYQVLDGHHRMHAARKAGLETLPAVIVGAEDIEYSDEVKEQVNEDLTQGRNLNDETEEYIKNHKLKLTTVNPMDLDVDGFDDPFGRVIDVDPDYPVNFKEPIIVHADGKTIIDGFHRAYQAQQHGLKELPAYVPEGINEASGYIPTKAQANDPRFKTALTVDVRPGEDQRNIEKLGLNLNMDLVNKTRPGKKRKKTLAESLMERYQSIKEEDLLEVEMSPSALRSWAKSDEAKGVRAGFELELIFADTEREEDEYSDEPNMDYDQPIGTLDDIVEFYDGDNYAWESLQPVEAERFRESVIDDLMDYEDEVFQDEWNDEGYEKVREEMIDQELNNFRDDNMDEIAQDAFDKNYDDLSANEEAYVDQKIMELFEEEIKNEFENAGYTYQRVYDAAYEDSRGNISWQQFWDAKNIDAMSDLLNRYDLVWPYQMSSMGGSLPIGSWGEEIANLTGKEVDISYTYHGDDKKEGNYTIEPDSSLSADEEPDSGYELVSPVMPLDEALDQLDKIMDWIEEQDGDVYTNSSTGFHMNISVPQGNEIDYTKLVLFSGDKYILDKYSRLNNNYAESALGQIETRAGMLEPERAYQAMQKMKTNLQDAAEEFLRGSTGQAKYTSIHIKDGYIEFRGPGGVYTNKSFGENMNTMLRFARAMTIAADPDAYRQEYQKKLYKIISKGQEKTSERTIDSLFADLQSGEINSEVFKKRWANLVVQQKQNQQILNKLDGVPDDRRTQKAKAIQQSSAGRPKPFKYDLPIEDAEGNRNALKGKITAASAQLAKQAAVDEIIERLKDPNLRQFKPRFSELRVEIDLEDPSNFVRYAYAIPYQDTRSPGEDKIYNNFIDVPKDLDMPTIRGRAIRHASENFFEPNADFTAAQTVQMDVEPVQLQPDYKNLATPAQPQDADEEDTAGNFRITIPYEDAQGQQEEHTVNLAAEGPEEAKEQAIELARGSYFADFPRFTPNYQDADVMSTDAAWMQ